MIRIVAGLCLSIVAGQFAIAQEANMLARATSVETSVRLNTAVDNLTDGDPATVWTHGFIVGGVEVVYRFHAPVAAGGITLVNTAPGRSITDRYNNLVTVWASHQAFGDGFFRLARGEMPKEGAVTLDFGEPVKFRSLKLIVENGSAVEQNRSNYGHEIRLAEVALTGTTDAAMVSRWPQPVPAPLDGLSAPISAGAATSCDDLAGIPFNPDSYGHFRLDRDVEVPAAYEACTRAVADAPESPRLAASLARVELMAERTPQAIARLTSPLLADYAPAQHLLAGLFANGIGVQENEMRAEEIFRAAADQGYGASLLWLARQAITGRATRRAAGELDEGEVAVDPELQAAVDLGYLPAYRDYFVAVMDLGTLPVAEAYALLERAAEFGDTDSANNYYVQLYNGYRISAQRKDSQRYARKLALRNSFNSMTNLVLDDAGAARGYWLRRAAYSGEYYPLEHYVRFAAPEERRAFLTDLAVSRVRDNALDGDDWAMEWLAQYHERGFGVEKDAEQARIWRCRAADSGNPVAISKSPACGESE